MLKDKKTSKDRPAHSKCFCYNIKHWERNMGCILYLTTYCTKVILPWNKKLTIFLKQNKVLPWKQLFLLSVCIERIVVEKEQRKLGEEGPNNFLTWVFGRGPIGCFYLYWHSSQDSKKCWKENDIESVKESREKTFLAVFDGPLIPLQWEGSMWPEFSAFSLL